ncbi:hypothetical protein HMN09_01218500 [Mycena chlorophos]|uniref:Uncharacterized protein n=1 Tax=Mycena chlorophos TaxID=658473 RepID=A0A8H6S6R6_MYCCL|nr:hypothetical protein HMN09_01218500 [Mycena chlorophos]
MDQLVCNLDSTTPQLNAPHLDPSLPHNWATLGPARHPNRHQQHLESVNGSRTDRQPKKRHGRANRRSHVKLSRPLAPNDETQRPLARTTRVSRPSGPPPSNSSWWAQIEAATKRLGKLDCMTFHFGAFRSTNGIDSDHPASRPQ